MGRTAEYHRRTNETEVSLQIDVNGTGAADISTTIPFLDHMLALFARHSLIDVTLTGRGDTAVDDHHLVEDIGICLGETVKAAVGNKEGIRRYGEATVPMDESLCSVTIDMSGRPYLVYRVDFEGRKLGNFDPALLREFFKSFSDHSGITLHINLAYGNNSHHMAEATFKAFALAMRWALASDNRREGIPSTKGSL